MNLDHNFKSLSYSIAEKKITTTTTSKTTTRSQIDTDNDKIPDYRDKCKTEPETYNGYKDADGCPDKKPQKIICRTTSEKMELCRI
jgi:hypothetical protein